MVIPVKAFQSAKVRLAPALTPAGRSELARFMAGLVVHAAGDLPVTVVCDDPVVREWAGSVGASVLWTPNLGLDGAVGAGVDAVTAAGAQRIVVAHSDLPLASGLDHVVGTDGVILVPDRRYDGSNVISLPALSGFQFSYGPGSFGRHQAEAARLGLAVTVLDDADLGWDVDIPDDLRLPGGADLAAGRRS